MIACAENWRGLNVLWQAQQPLSDTAALLPRLADILKQHALPSPLRTVFIAPPGIGGLLVSPALAQASRDDAWCRHQLEHALPYPIADVRHGRRQIGEQIQFYWVPLEWLNRQKALLQKLGLQLDSVFPRALLFETSLPTSSASPANPALLSEAFATEEWLYGLHAGRLQHAVAIPAGLDATARAAYLSGMTGGDAPALATPATLTIQTTPAVRPPWPDRLPALWQNLDLTIAVDAATESLWRPFYRLAIAVAVVTTVLAAALNWVLENQETALAQALRDKKSLTAAMQRFNDLERAVRDESTIVAAVSDMNAAPTPLPLLLRFTQILPKTAWVHHLVFDGKSMVVAGKGIGDAELIGLLQGANLEAMQMRPEPVTETDSFRLRVLEKPEPASGGAS